MNDFDNLIETIDSLVDWQMTDSPAAKVQAARSENRYTPFNLRYYDETDRNLQEALRTFVEKLWHD